jgi:hypothetical protein
MIAKVREIILEDRLSTMFVVLPRGFETTEGKWAAQTGW